MGGIETVMGMEKKRRTTDESGPGPERLQRPALGPNPRPALHDIEDLSDARTLSSSSLLGLQATAGNASVAAILASKSEVGGPLMIQRDEAATAAPVTPTRADMNAWADVFQGHKMNHPPDMSGASWEGLPHRTTPPAVLKAVSIQLPEKPPPTQDVYQRPSTVCPSCHDTEQHKRELAQEMHDMEVRFLNIERQDDWNAIRVVMATVEGTWNAAVPLVNQYKDAESDPSLHGGHKAETLAAQGVQEPHKGDTFETLAERQQVPATGPAAQRESVGAVLKTPSGGVAEQRQLEAASTNPAIHEKAQTAQRAEAQLAHMVAGVQRAMVEYNAAMKDVAVALDLVDQVDAEDKRDIAQDKLNEIIEEKNETKEVIKGFIEFTEGAIKLGGGFEAVDKVEGGSGIAGVLADVIVGAAFAARINEAKARAAEAVEKVRSLIKKGATDKLEAAWAHLKVAEAKREEATRGVSPALIDRKTAYDSLAAGEQASGGGGAVQSHAAGAVGAIPIIEAVIGRASAIVAAVESGKVSYSQQAGVGYTMALAAYPEVVVSFVDSYYQLHGLRADFLSRREKWEKHLQQVMPVKDKLLGVKNPEEGR